MNNVETYSTCELGHLTLQGRTQIIKIYVIY